MKKLNTSAEGLEFKKKMIIKLKWGYTAGNMLDMETGFKKSRTKKNDVNVYPRKKLLKRKP